MAASDAAEEKVKYTLTYFDLPMRAESIRCTLAIGGEVYQDKRIAFSEWPELKENTRWGGLPTLELEDGTVLGQSHNILRHVGRMTGYYPFHDLSRASRVDELLAAWYDAMQTVAGAGAGMEAEAKIAARVACVAEDGPVTKLLHKVDSAIEEFTDGTYAVGRQLSIADIATWAYSCALASGGLLDGVPQDFVNQFENIMKIRFQVAKIPAVKKYLSKHADDGAYEQYKRRSLNGEDEEEVEEKAAAEEEAPKEEAEVNDDAEAPKEEAIEVNDAEAPKEEATQVNDDAEAPKAAATQVNDDAEAPKAAATQVNDEAEAPKAAATQVNDDAEAPKEEATEVAEEIAGGDEFPQTPAVEDPEAELADEKRGPETEATN